MSLTFNLRLLATVQISTALTSKLYQLNHNISKVSLQSALVEDEIHAVRGVVNCASICHHKDNNGLPCNGFVLEKDGSCQLANVSFLEESADLTSFYLDVTTKETLELWCNGGTDCCLAARDGTKLCQEGEGDCGRNSDCDGLLVCGENNCVTQFGMAGEFWDDGDDCCRQRCDADYPCNHGEGTCSKDSDCDRPGYSICQKNCLNKDWFPTAQFPNNTHSFGFSTTDSCCRRACMPASPCGNGVEGCLHDEDCLDGFDCEKHVERPFCKDYYECSDHRTWVQDLVTSYCGLNTVCKNTVGSFTCPCNPGHTNFVAYSGCEDVDECKSTSLNNCGVNTDCINTAGSYNCVCHPGFDDFIEDKGCGYVVTANHLQTEDMHVVLNKGSYGVFLVGGGGYGSISMMGAASGYFSYTVVQIEADLTRADVDIGGGGYSGHVDGWPTSVIIGDTELQAGGGGGNNGAGWSGGGDDTVNGASNGGTANSGPGSGESLPSVPGITLTPGAGGTSDLADGGGGGGVVINGQAPYRNYAIDGVGYGAGAGEKNHNGMGGAAVFVKL